ncbi:MAG: Dam family site-specific DNA-(adenine-N6)-methyltransferase [Nitrospira sp.]|nr:MAG: Dam family site-specific DNA-(adenine-N6)-methyltransferase [Nitrospira sp.]
MQKIDEAVTKPFLKWPGGKRWLAQTIAKFLQPRLQGQYFEPFLGGGAVFFALHPTRATLSDINSDLVNVYRRVRDQPVKVLAHLKRIPVTSKEYYSVRTSNPACKIKQAAQFLYLNRTAFGGIYRLNKEGQFNVPYGGGDRTPTPLWRDNLITSGSKTLQGVALKISDFEPMVDMAVKGDAVYCDPTYTVAHENNGFVRYNERNFSWSDQERLAAAALRAYKRGALVIVSNAYHPSIRKLYSEFTARRFTRKSLVSASADARRTVHEYLLILDPQK